MSLAAAPAARAPHSGVHGGDAGAGCLIDYSAAQWGREGGGGGGGAFVCGVCASEASLGSAPGAAAVPGRGGALRGAGPGEAGGEGPGCSGLRLWGRRAGALAGPGPGALAPPAISILPGDASPGGGGSGLR